MNRLLAALGLCALLVSAFALPVAADCGLGASDQGGSCEEPTNYVYPEDNQGGGGGGIPDAVDPR